MRDKCWLLDSGSLNGGGNPLYASLAPKPSNRILIKRHLALGDILCATTVADKLADQNILVDFTAHPAGHCILRLHPAIATVMDPQPYADINLDGAYENDADRKHKHFHEMFFHKANADLRRFGMSIGSPINCTPRLVMPPRRKTAASIPLQQYPKPWIGICPRSQNYAARTVSDLTWSQVAAKLPGTKFWLGMHPGPSGIVDLNLRHFDRVIDTLSVLDLLLSTDTGPMHVAAALRTPVIVLAQSSFPDSHLSDQNDYRSLYPEGDLKCLDCQKNICPIKADIPPCQNFSPDKVAAEAMLRLNSTGKVSAAVSVYRPKAEVLNKCLEHLIPQVDEIIVCRDEYGQFPQPRLAHPKIKYITKHKKDIGYGKKQNYAVRNTNGEFVLLVNDDVFLNPDAVPRMVELMKEPKVGLVANFLQYPNGTIYHAGKTRSPGMMGWGHIDHRKYIPTIKEPVQMENVCGACVLVRRTAFYDINGFDERFFLYAEDDDMALSLGRAGWKIMYQPHSTGIHMEHQSTDKTAKIVEIMHESNRMFGDKWGPYLRHNKDRIPGNYEYV